MYYAAPHVTSVSPSFGHVKAAKPVTVAVAGSGFACLSAGCSDLLCRFGNRPDQYIYVKAALVSETQVNCVVPQYTKPDVLNVEVTINGESYTNDNKTYGFFDPFVLSARPRLIATDGTTKVAVEGLGFVDSGQAKVLYANKTAAIVCSGSNCTKPAVFRDKRTLVAPTFAQSEVTYKSSGKSVLWDPMYIEATVLGDEFTDNQVEVFYY